MCPSVFLGESLYYTFDIETEGLALGSPFLIGAIYTEGVKPTLFYNVNNFCENLLDIVRTGKHIMCHNSATFDFPRLQYLAEFDFLEDLAFFKYQCHDSLVISQIMFPERFKHSLEEWGITVGHAKVRIDFANATDKDIERRVCGDVRLNYALLEYLQHHGWPQAIPCYKSIQEFNHVASLMGAVGVPHDQEEMKRLRSKLMYQRSKSYQQVRKTLGDINVNSNVQIHKALLAKTGKGLPLGEPSEITKKRSPILNSKNRAVQLQKFPILSSVLEVKDLDGVLRFLLPAKGKTYFGNAVMYSKKWERDCIFPSFRVWGTVTGRGQYSGPPVNQLSKQIRKVVESPKGHLLVGADVVGLEYRIFGFLTKTFFGITDIWDEVEQGLCPKQRTFEIFEPFLDRVFVAKGNSILGVCKTINYAILFGIGMPALGGMLGYADEADITQIRALREERFPGLGQLTSYLQSQIVADKITNIFGVQIPTPAYKVVNSTIQSSGALYSKALLYLFYVKLSALIVAKPILYNMDELLIAVNDVGKEFVQKRASWAVQEAHEEFEQRYNVPLIAPLKMAVGKTWDDVH